ncbi:MAG: hypothetical protein ACFB4I_20500 [Cyanophyceae cyanobacterium]
MKAVISRKLSIVLASETGRRQLGSMLARGEYGGTVKADGKTYRVVALRGTHRRTKRVFPVEFAKKEN